MIGFRFNVSSRVGHGHFVRCNAIANALGSQGIQTVAILDESSELPCPNSFSKFVTISAENDAQETAIQCKTLNVTSLLVDHYHCDLDYQQVLIGYDICWGQYDFYCDGHYLGHFVININPAAKLVWYQECSLGVNTKLFLGATYAALKSLDTPKKSSNSDGSVLLCVGAGDDNGLLSYLSELLCQLSSIQRIHIICNSASTSVKTIQLRNNEKEQLHLDTSNINHIASLCQFAVITAGTLAFELNYLGLPFVIGYIAENQQKLAQSWEDSINAPNVGNLKHLTLSSLSEAVDQLILSPDGKKADEKVAYRLVDGQAAKRIAKVLYSCS